MQQMKIEQSQFLQTIPVSMMQHNYIFEVDKREENIKQDQQFRQKLPDYSTAALQQQ